MNINVISNSPRGTGICSAGSHRSTLQLVSWPCRPDGRKLTPYLEKVDPRGLAPTRSWTWEVASSQLFRAAFVRKEQNIG
jgi:hypothetical protein